jgi:hypothetical protein
VEDECLRGGRDSLDGTSLRHTVSGRDLDA